MCFVLVLIITSLCTAVLYALCTCDEVGTVPFLGINKKARYPYLLTVHIQQYRPVFLFVVIAFKHMSSILYCLYSVKITVNGLSMVYRDITVNSVFIHSHGITACALPITAT